jgi:putative Holliday junction resolvase
MTSHQSYFGIDYGTRKIGVAVGQTLTHTAMGIAVVPVRNGEVEWKELDSLVARWKPDAFVVGMPYNMDGTESDMTAAAQKFARRISERTREALAAAKARGRQLGGTRPGTIRENARAKAAAADRSEALRPVLAPMAAAGMSLREMAHALYGAGTATANGEALSPTQVRRHLERLGLRPS